MNGNIGDINDFYRMHTKSARHNIQPVIAIRFTDIVESTISMRLDKTHGREVVWNHLFFFSLALIYLWEQEIRVSKALRRRVAAKRTNDWP